MVPLSIIWCVAVCKECMGMERRGHFAMQAIIICYAYVYVVEERERERLMSIRVEG